MGKRKKKSLEEMSLIDDFLMNEVIGNEEHGSEVFEKATYYCLKSKEIKGSEG